MGVPLSTLLSQALVALTIELDNEFERRFDEAGGGARVTSLVMWSNLLRFVGDGIAVGELPAAVGLQKSRVSRARRRGALAVRLCDPGTPRGSAKERRDGYGSARGLEDDWVVRLTPCRSPGGGDLAGAPELRSRRVGARGSVPPGSRGSRKRCASWSTTTDLALPEYLPIVGSSNGMALELPIAEKGRQPTADLPLVALLAQALMAYTVEFEARSALSLALGANVVRVLDEDGVLVRELPSRSGVSKEAVAMA